ncbi:5-formyltetrahydrofolate cyclo-ligase OS=Ureibacillus acetophenoni OX=614649 GN=SAMN05877842_102166 PE=3 SV=1 [Ureibacillus acetophenoni]
MDKKELRNQVKGALSQLSDEQYKGMSKQITDQLLKEEAIKNANTIAVTLSNKPEVDTYLLIEELWKGNKKVVVPKCNPKDRSMQFYKINSFNQLEKVYMNLKEPIVEITQPVNSDEIDVILVPGVVYDFDGYRIGFGGGYYDRYLVNYSGTLISLGFSIQLIEKVPRESHDIPVNLILTENKRIECGKKRKESLT